MGTPRRLYRAVLAIAAVAVAGVLAQQAGQGPDGTAARPLILGAATGTGAEDLKSPDPEVLRVVRERAASRAAVDRYCAEYLAANVLLAKAVGADATSQYVLSHGHDADYCVSREHYADGRVHQRVWRARLQRTGRTQCWWQYTWDGTSGEILTFYDELAPGPCRLESLRISNPKRLELQSPEVLQLDLAGPWQLLGDTEQMRTAPSRHLGQETLQGLVCDKLQYLAGRAEAGRTAHDLVTRWVCPERDYRDVRSEQRMDLRGTPGQLGNAAWGWLIRQVDRFVKRRGHWYPAGYHQEYWIELVDGRYVLAVRWIRAVQRLEVGEDAPPVAANAMLSPPGAMTNDGGGLMADTDTRQPYERLEQCLRDGDWLQARAAATALGAGP